MISPCDLSVVVQAEIEKEMAGQRPASQSQQTFSSAGLDQSSFIGPELPGGRSPPSPASPPSPGLSLEELSLEQLVARAEQRQLAEQEEQLRAIIDFQRRREAA